jgi:hypothetical protein
LRGDGQAAPEAVSAGRQQQAIDALIATLDPSILQLPPQLIAMIPPRPPNNPKSRETFRGASGIVFDAKSPAASSVALTLNVLLNPSRAARLEQGGTPGLVSVASDLLDATWQQKPAGGLTGAIQRQTNLQIMYALLKLAFNSAADSDVRAIALDAVDGLDTWLSRQSTKDSVLRAHYGFARFEIGRLRQDPSELSNVVPVVVPPGSPIGSFQTRTH